MRYDNPRDEGLTVLENELAPVVPISHYKFPATAEGSIECVKEEYFHPASRPQLRTENYVLMTQMKTLGIYDDLNDSSEDKKEEKKERKEKKEKELAPKDTQEKTKLQE